jgi:hypothetical protein
MVRPSAFAVLRLMTSSNFVGCPTWRSSSGHGGLDLREEPGAWAERSWRPAQCPWSARPCTWRR